MPKESPQTTDPAEVEPLEKLYRELFSDDAGEQVSEPSKPYRQLCLRQPSTLTFVPSVATHSLGEQPVG